MPHNDVLRRRHAFAAEFGHYGCDTLGKALFPLVCCILQTVSSPCSLLPGPHEPKKVTIEAVQTAWSCHLFIINFFRLQRILSFLCSCLYCRHSIVIHCILLLYECNSNKTSSVISAIPSHTSANYHRFHNNRLSG